MPELGTLTVEHVIVHDVPRHRAGEEGPGPTLSETESPLDDELSNYLRERVIESLARHSLVVEFDPAGTATVREGIGALLKPRARVLVETSQALAKHLYTVQTGTNPAGLLVVFRGKFGGQPAVGILKLEREEAIRLNQSDVGGKKTFKLRHLRDLVLNKNTRVFKSGLFYMDGAEIAGLVRDEQRGYLQDREVAYFFLKTFLGCKLKEEPDVTTKVFYDTVERFIREEVRDPEAKSRYTIAVQAELNSTALNVDTRHFARQHLEVEHQDMFEQRIREAGVPPKFVKDVERIKTRLRSIRMDFDEEIALLASRRALDEVVKTEQRQNGKMHVEFDATLRDIRGK